MIKALHNLHPPFWLILGGSLCEDLGFFHSFKTSPRSSKSESGCKSYACFSFGISAVFVLAGCPGFAPDVRAARRISGPMSGSLLSREHFCADIYSGCPGLGRMSGLPGRPGCPGFSRISGPLSPVPVPKSWLCSPDVRLLARCPGPDGWPDVRAFPGYPGPLFFLLRLCTSCGFSTAAGCPALARMSGPALSLTLKRLVFLAHYIYPLTTSWRG
jgi:hypothetical protein